MSRSNPSPEPADLPVPDSVLDLMRLIWAVDHELQSISKRMERSIGLTVPQRMALLLIGRQRGILGGELAQLLHLHPGTVSGVVGRLEEAGLITREGDTRDGRRRRLTLTAAGRRANRRHAGTFEAAVRRVLAESPEAERRSAAELLRRLAAALRATGQPRSSTPVRRRR